MSKENVRNKFSETNIGRKFTEADVVNTGKKRAARLIYGRTLFVFVAVALQITILYLVAVWLDQYQYYISSGFTLLAAVLVLIIINNKSNPAFKMSWIVPILIFPVFGGLFYLFVHLQTTPKKLNKRYKQLQEITEPYLDMEKVVDENLITSSKQRRNLAHYVEKTGGYPTYQNTDVTYFPLGEDAFKEMIVQLEKAEKFIFMEYFIIEKGYMWETILEILKRKAKEGVEVRVLYDGLCSLARLPYSYPKQLHEFGIKCKIFEQVIPLFSTHQNNRDHRKVLVIDGKVAFNGGINIADEYINRKSRFGHWKDNAVMLEGEAVRGFTLMFLQMWNVTEHEEEQYDKYLTEELHPTKDSEKGFVMPYGDSPLDGDTIGEYVYMDMINTATDYVHIMTPYLILDNEMITALVYAVKRGVEVKIILPHIPDKKYAFALAHNHYPQLLEAGVKIYEYMPGFVHAKMFTVDDKKAIVGTINMDYRSFYLHFECATYLYQCPVISIMEADFQKTIGTCMEMTMEDYKYFSNFHKLMGHILKLIAPLM